MQRGGSRERLAYRDAVTRVTGWRPDREHLGYAPGDEVDEERAWDRFGPNREMWVLVEIGWLCQATGKDKMGVLRPRPGVTWEDCAELYRAAETARRVQGETNWRDPSTIRNVPEHMRLMAPPMPKGRKRTRAQRAQNRGGA